MNRRANLLINFVVGSVALCIKVHYFDRESAVNDVLEWLLLSREQNYGQVYLHFCEALQGQALKIIRQAPIAIP